MVTAAADPPRHGLGLAAGSLAVLTFALWGGNNLAVKISVEALPPLAAAFYRFALGLGFFLLMARLRGDSLRLEQGQFAPLAGLALLFIVQIATLNVGTVHTSAARGTVFLGAHPLFIALFAALLAGERLGLLKVVGLGLAFAGVVATFADAFLGAGETLLGDGLMLLSAVLLGLRLVVLKKIIATMPQFRALAWQVGLSLPVFALLTLTLERGRWGDVGARHVFAMLYQGVVVAGFCFSVNAWLYQRFRAGDVAAYTFTVPLWGVLFCYLIAGDPVTAWLAAGVGLVALGIAIASRGGAPPGMG